MIPSLIVIGIAFIWMLKESDFLRVRLLVGNVPELELPLERKSWEDILEDKPSYRYLPNFLRMNNGFEYFAPLCGWDWLRDTMHVIPEPKVEMQIGGVRYSMTIKQPTIIKDVMRVNKVNKKQKLAYC